MEYNLKCWNAKYEFKHLTFYTLFLIFAVDCCECVHTNQLLMIHMFFHNITYNGDPFKIVVNMSHVPNIRGNMAIKFKLLENKTYN